MESFDDDDLFKALEADGYKVTATIQHRVANFANLKVKVPGLDWKD